MSNVGGFLFRAASHMPVLVAPAIAFGLGGGLALARARTIWAGLALTAVSWLLLVTASVLWITNGC